MKRRGFTLIELLMVMALIALLMAILVPGMQTVLRMAARAKCGKQLESIGKALTAYLNNNGTWPRRVKVEYPHEYDTAWHKQMLTQYLTDPRVLYCPDSFQEKKPAASDAGSDTWPTLSGDGVQGEFTYVILDGVPGPDNAEDPGKEDGANSWASSEGRHGMRAMHKFRTWDPSLNNGKGAFGPWQDEYPMPFIRPHWTTYWLEHNAPIAGDLILERANDDWLVNHVTTTPRQDPMGMNVLYAAGHVSWVTPEVEAADEAGQDRQRLFRRIFRKSNDEFVRFLWNPTDFELPANSIK